MKNNSMQQPFSALDYLWFIIPSLIGVFLFMVPIPSADSISIPVAHVASMITSSLGDLVPTIMTFLIVASVLGSIFFKFLPQNVQNSSFLTNLFQVSPIWLVVRLLGMVFALMTLYQIGPEVIFSEYTGGLLMFELIPVLFSVFLLAGFFLPLLLNFGLLELFGALLTKVMRPLFKLPGRSSMDCLTSWLGDGTIGVLLTSKQFEDGYYTKREAATIGTTFSVVSITFTIVVISYMNLEQYFIPFYLTITLAGLAASIIMPRIPPLSRKEDSAYEGTELKLDESIPKQYTSFKWGVIQAVKQAKKNRNVAKVAKQGIQNVLDMWLGVIPVVMAIGTVALVIAEHTLVFQYLGAPFVPILSLLQVPEASEAAQTIVVGFADMFLPAVIGSGIESELTRFVIAALSVTQLIYMSEVGGLLLGSKIPVSFKDLVIIFIERTFITLPIIVLIAHIIF
ncbi:YjiH family protein [Bacillus solimangrovi]|uniref:Nucleoside transporter/FeoB GTPase Gate domain-containing protein n=1 Tax=Bacillus solimangrovi TaxID=1305675 RepID=A0A1E5LDE6_9BACI|nr:YjiH family protein [Bacillus solimangrovi]OEH92103.1 hypothetical protein BFG57_16805 [Bacillus solimangrovi]